MEKIWIIQDSPQAEITQLSRDLGVSEVVAGILWRRDLRSMERARDFFNPSTDLLLDPYTMLNMDEAVNQVKQRKQVW